MANFDYVVDHKNAGTKDITENDSHTIDAAKCMYFGNQLSTLQSCLVSGYHFELYYLSFVRYSFTHLNTQTSS